MEKGLVHLLITSNSFFFNETDFEQYIFKRAFKSSFLLLTKMLGKVLKRILTKFELLPVLLLLQCYQFVSIVTED